MDDLSLLPAGLPEPQDDGAAKHLHDMRIPSVSLVNSSGTVVDLGSAQGGRTVVFVYPMTGPPDQDLPDGWDTIPGARGCSPEACDFRDNAVALIRSGVDKLYGLSAQTSVEQREAITRLHLPYALIADPELVLRDALNLPTFTVEGRTYYKRISLIIEDGFIRDVFYPVFPPDEAARRVLARLVNRGRPMA